MSTPLALSLLFSCGPRSAPVASSVDGPGSAPAASAATQEPEPFDHGASIAVRDADLAALLEEHWEGMMQRAPTWASRLGDLRWPDRLSDPSPQARTDWLEARRGWLARADALAALTELDAGDRVTVELLALDLRTGIDVEVACAFHEWSMSARSNPLVGTTWLTQAPRLDTAADGDALLARLAQVPATVDAATADLRVGLESGRVTNAHSSALVVEMIEAELAADIADSALLKPAAAEALDAWDSTDAAAFRVGLAAVVADTIRPALERYVRVVADEVVSAGGTGDDVGLSSVLGDSVCYEALVHSYTTLDRSADELHQTGLDELARIHDEFRTIGDRVWGLTDVEQIFERLRTDPELYFDSAESVVATAVDALDRAREAMPGAFGRLPQATCTVEPVPDYLAPYTTIAYYSQPRPDGSKPGIYFVNTQAPETRPRHEAEVLAFHESIPGHHLQIAIAQELDALPAFRRHLGQTAFVEGWALYTERLSDELGLYSDDLSRLGMLSFDAWRASRLVVDTGIHAQGWSRERAETFLHDNTPLAANNIDNEIDRYITTPGQALAYKSGQLELVRLRAHAEAELGDAFELSAFHDAVLGGGAVSLPVLEDQVLGWIAQRIGNSVEETQ